MKTDLNDLVVFTHVVDAGSFTAAARGLGLPKSAVSRRIARLEEQLGVRLLHRTTRKLNLTDAGRTLYDRGARIVSDVKDVERAVAEMQERPRGLLRVTAPVEFPSAAQLVTGFLNLFPEVQIDLDLTNRYVDLVEEGIDVAVRAGQLADSSLVAKKLGDGRRILVASPAYLATRGTPADIGALSDHDCILFGPWSAKATWSLIGPRGPLKVPVRGRISVNHLDAVRRVALAGLGIAVLPVDWIANDLTAERLSHVLPDVNPPPGSIWAVYPSRKHVPPTVRAFVDYLKTSFAEHIPPGVPTVPQTV